MVSNQRLSRVSWVRQIGAASQRITWPIYRKADESDFLWGPLLSATSFSFVFRQRIVFNELL